MTHTPDVLLVAPNPEVAAGIRQRLLDAGMRVTMVETFVEGREQLQALPDLLISEVRLGDYNGLHLALRARSSGIPAIVLGKEDAVTEREAEKLGAMYVPTDGDDRHLTAAIRAAGIRIPTPKVRGRRSATIHAA
jgi:DNA-binding response OmpR family regulator